MRKVLASIDLHGSSRKLFKRMLLVWDHWTNWDWNLINEHMVMWQLESDDTCALTSQLDCIFDGSHTVFKNKKTEPPSHPWGAESKVCSPITISSSLSLYHTHTHTQRFVSNPVLFTLISAGSGIVQVTMTLICTPGSGLGCLHWSCIHRDSMSLSCSWTPP